MAKYEGKDSYAAEIPKAIKQIGVVVVLYNDMMLSEIKKNR